MTFIDIPEALQDDAEILAATKNLILGSLAHAQELLDEGIPSIKMGVLRGILPAAVKLAGREKSQDEEIAELRAQIERMYAEMHAGIDSE